MIAKFSKQINGIGHFAQIEYEINEIDNPKRIINDQCKWKSMNRVYENFEVGETLINFKKSVLQGMQYGLSRIKWAKSLEINLIDIVVLNTDSSNTSMFIVGIKSIFEGLDVQLTKSDQVLINSFVSENYKENKLSNFTKFELSYYQ